MHTLLGVNSKIHVLASRGSSFDWPDLDSQISWQDYYSTSPSITSPSATSNTCCYGNTGMSFYGNTDIIQCGGNTNIMCLSCCTPRRGRNGSFPVAHWYRVTAMDQISALKVNPASSRFASLSSLRMAPRMSGCWDTI